MNKLDVIHADIGYMCAPVSKQEAHGPRFTHLSKMAIANLQTPYNFFSSIATFPPYKSIRLQIWPCHRKVNGLEAFLAREKMFWWYFVPYIGMTVILFNHTERFVQIDNMPSTEGPKCNLVKIGKAVSENKTFKDYEILYKHIAQGQGQTTMGTNFSL